MKQPITRLLLILLIVGGLGLPAVFAQEQSPPADTLRQVAPADTVQRPAPADTVQLGVSQDTLQLLPAQPDTAQGITPADTLQLTTSPDTTRLDSLPTDTLRLNDEQIRALARAVVAIQEIRSTYRARQGALQDTMSATGDLYTQFQAAVARVLEEQELTLEVYAVAMKNARKDSVLRRRIVDHVAEVRLNKADGN